ncbi:unnamed protein product, partial [Oncorhynchus mykiss]
AVLTRNTGVGVKDLGSHFRFYDQSPTPNPEPDPRGLSQGGGLDMENIPLEFHKENTVTNDLPLEGFEDEDYIDFDKILAEGGDDYSEGDEIDEIATPLQISTSSLNPQTQRRGGPDSYAYSMATRASNESIWSTPTLALNSTVAFGTMSTRPTTFCWRPSESLLPWE